MKQEYWFDDENLFLDKLQELIKSGISKRDIKVVMPHPVHGIDEILHIPPSKLRLFTLIGAITGTITGFAFTIYTVLSWPLITGGKPLVSIPAFVIIAFELTILFGALASFSGFLILSKLPSVKRIISPKEYGNKFVILIDIGG